MGIVHNCMQKINFEFKAMSETGKPVIPNEARPSTPSPMQSLGLLGILAATAVVVVWSGWVVLSRSGVQGGFSIWDLGALRFGTAAICVLPLMMRSSLPISGLFAPKVALPALAAGSVYVLLSFAALESTAATNAGVVVNGLIPIATMALFAAFTGKRPGWADAGVAAALLAANALLLQGALIGLGAFLLFVAAAVSLAFYMVSVRHWHLDPKQFFFAVPIVNGAVMLPLWLIFDASLAGTDPGAIVLQAVYQGILVSLGAITLLTFAIRVIGPVSASMIMAAVPFATALLALVVLGEPLTGLHLIALILCSAGLLSHAWLSRPKA